MIPDLILPRRKRSQTTADNSLPTHVYKQKVTDTHPVIKVV